MSVTINNRGEQPNDDVEYDVIDAVAMVLEERGIANPCEEEDTDRRAQYGHEGFWHLRPGRTWADVEAVEVEVSRKL